MKQKKTPDQPGVGDVIVKALYALSGERVFLRNFLRATVANDPEVYADMERKKAMERLGLLDVAYDKILAIVIDQRESEKSRDSQRLDQPDPQP